MTKTADGQMLFAFYSDADEASQILLSGKKQLSPTAKKLLKILPAHQGKANSITSKELVKLCGVDSRTITSGVAELKLHGYPACSSRNDNYWWSVDPVEFNEYLEKLHIENGHRNLIEQAQRNSPLGQALIVNPESTARTKKAAKLNRKSVKNE